MSDLVGWSLLPDAAADGFVSWTLVLATLLPFAALGGLAGADIGHTIARSLIRRYRSARSPEKDVRGTPRQGLP